MAVDPSLLATLREMQDRIRRLENGIPLQNASVTRGRLRFIGGLLRVDAGGRVEIVGALQVDGETTVTGTFTVTGDFTVEGNLTVTGPWNLEGAGTITGDVTVTGKVTQVGDMDIDGVLTVNGSGWSITGDGEISGKVSLTGSLEVAEGGYIQVGPTRISGATDGFISSLISIVVRTPLLNVDGALGVSQGAVFEGSVSMPGLVPIALADAPAGAFAGAIFRDATKRLRVVVA
ncbi:hypothetical protein AB1K56_07950 [Microbacterium sp. BWR-S6Y]|uniref:hypothetical protein n=1 Tax=Microbacterium sp. BWR-S6Y TaxID=3232073 RepID=UPI003527B393